MWYNGVLPVMAIITGTLSAPTIINYYLMKWNQYGNPYRRDLSFGLNRDLYFRDMRLNGNPYVIHGLDNIPDGDEPVGSGQDDTKPSDDSSWHTTPCPKS